MGSDDRHFEKGFFTEKRLPVAEKYVDPPGRGPLFLVGGVAVLAVSGIFLADVIFGSAAAVTHGPLSENHALFGAECSTCHTPWEGAPDVKCLQCHQKFGGELGHYTFDRHYVFRSGDFDRSAPSSMELPCATCHREHEGREASLSRVADARCQSCHGFQSFADGHPEFEFAREPTADPANLRFPHTIHVRELMDEFGLVDVEDACLRCHTPEPTGRFFQPLSFERQCDACHLSSGTATPFLPLRTGADQAPGVETLAAIRARGGASSLWAEFWNPNEFMEVPGEIRKRPVYHEDPWVLHNLRRLRQELYPGAQLADLLRTSAHVPPQEVHTLVREAAETLREQIHAIQGDPSPAVQSELQGLRELLAEVERRIERPFGIIDESRFGVRITDRAPGLATGELDEGAYLAVVDSLTAACQTCHVVDRATIRRVQKDQRSLIRAEFDHRAHVIHARCLDCHSAIPMREFLAAGEDPPPELDRAEIQNLPTMETCLTCHAGQGPAARCVSCHFFHPDKDHWANLSRYQRRSP